MRTGDAPFHEQCTQVWRVVNQANGAIPPPRSKTSTDMRRGLSRP